MNSIAIIGTGIAGLGAAHQLHRDYDVELFDGNAYAGGHTNTITVDEEGRALPIDTGFMVFNEVTYPNLTALFRELGVATKPAAMSFGVQHVADGLEYCGSSVGQLFAQRRNLFRPRFLRMLYQVDRFNREAEAALSAGCFERVTLQQYADARGYGEDFLRFYLLPMCSAVWSTEFERVRDFPVMTLLRFFRNHGLLGGLKGHHQWLTVEGGAKSYVEKLTAPFRSRIHLGSGVGQVRRDGRGVELTLLDGTSRRFDKVVFACHADEALAILGAGATADERRLLGAFRYQRNVATLHTDERVMPRSRRAWASWNYRIETVEGRARASTIYWMNSLQGVSDRRNYFVSIDDRGRIDESTVLRRIVYHHPVFDVAAIEAQRDLPSLNTGTSTFFCGSYFRYGFHEDALTSGINAARAVASSDVRSDAA